MKKSWLESMLSFLEKLVGGEIAIDTEFKASRPLLRIITLTFPAALSKKDKKAVYTIIQGFVAANVCGIKKIKFESDKVVGFNLFLNSSEALASDASPFITGDLEKAHWHNIINSK